MTVPVTSRSLLRLVGLLFLVGPTTAGEDAPPPALRPDRLGSSELAG